MTLKRYTSCDVDDCGEKKLKKFQDFFSAFAESWQVPDSSRHGFRRDDTQRAHASHVLLMSS